VTDALQRLSALTEHPIAVYLAGLAPSSRVRMAKALIKACALLAPGQSPVLYPWASLRAPVVAFLRTELAQRCGLSDANVILCAVRGVLRACADAQETPDAGLLRAATVKGVRGERITKGRHISPGELIRLFAACKTHAAGLRTRALLALLYYTGARCEELCTAQLADLSETGDSLRVLGKGNRERVVPLSRAAWREVARYLEVRGEAPGPLLYASRTARTLEARALSASAARALVDTVCEHAKVPRSTPHDFRRTFVGELLDRGVDLVRVQALCGHRSAATTARYDRRGLREAARAVELLPDTECV
jgi:integrase